MSRLPNPGGDDDNWGGILNDFLLQSLSADGTLKSGVVSAGAIADGTISEAKLEAAVQTKLNSGGTAGVSSVNTRTGAVTLTKSDVGLANVDNTSDAAKNSAAATLTNKTISGSANTLNNISADSLVDGSTNRLYTSAEKTKLGGLQAALDAKVTGVTMTQSEYDALSSPRPAQLYIIIPE